MKMHEIYKSLRGSIVAFVQKYIPIYDKDSPPPQFPPIIGTGFFVKENGIIATNAHVVKAFSKVYRPSDANSQEWPVRAILFKLTDSGMLEIPLEILGVGTIGKFDFGKVYYGPKEGPDIAFVQVKAKDLECVTIDSTTLIEEGMGVGTAGFPMGTDALVAPGWFHQATPTLQSGIVSAVLPFVSKTPHAYSINIMTQGGASGSPVFSCETGKIIGILYAGLFDFGMTLNQKELYRVPTNISYVVPSHYIVTSLNYFLANPNTKLPSDVQSIDEMLSNAQLQNIFDKGRNWQIKTIDPSIENLRVQNVVKFDIPKN